MVRPFSRRDRRIVLYYLSGNTTGGWITYTAHLVYGLRILGIRVDLLKIGNHTESKQRPFGYGLTYQNVSLEDAVGYSSSSVIVALQKNFRERASALLDHGAWMVVHDPAEFANLKLARTGRYITIRRAVNRRVEGSVFIPHPYLRHFRLGTRPSGKVHACSIARIDFDKHTEIMLDANRRLPKSLRIQINGFENRIYSRFKLCPKYPEWEQSKSHYPRERQAAADICRESKFTVDMSLIKGDGGGTQYTFMEAMDAGSVNIIHRGWILPGDEMIPYPEPGANCLAVSDGDELADLLKNCPGRDDLDDLAENGEQLLEHHNPLNVAEQFIQVLGI